MPTKRKTYAWTRLPREALRELIALADDVRDAERRAYLDSNQELVKNYGDSIAEMMVTRSKYGLLTVSDDDGQTTFESVESADFFSRLGDPYTAYSMSYGILSVDFRANETSVSVGHPDSRVVDRIMASVRDAAAANAIPIPEPEPERPRVFIGHGGSGEWEKTERWLRTLGIEVKAYETLPHSGRTIERVLTGALEWANFALLVMTAEDERADRTVQARQNVVHELGLFQGRLGWDQALVMLEDGTTEFSNIAGTNQLRFPAGMIDAKHGDVIVALRERFPGIL